MKQETDLTQSEALFELINENGCSAMADVYGLLLNQAMEIDRSRYLGAAAYERTDKRIGYANGFKPKTIATTAGKMTVKVPQVRDGNFYPGVLEKGMRSDRAFYATLAQMYINGVSTRKVDKILEKMCGFGVSSTQVSRATAMLDTEFEHWRNREIGEIAHLILDARYEKVRREGIVQSTAVLVAIGVAPDGRRSIIGVSIDISEAEVHWRDFLKTLVSRGLHGLTSITSDDHMGLTKAVTTVFPSVTWQRCQVHLQRNAFAYVSKKDRKAAVAADIRGIFNAKNLEKASEELRDIVQKYRDEMPKLSEWMEENIPEGLAVFSLPTNVWKKLRTSNCIERFNEELKRRTAVVRVFPNVKSLERLITALCVEKSDEWEGGDKRYINMEKECL